MNVCHLDLSFKNSFKVFEDWFFKSSPTTPCVGIQLLHVWETVDLVSVSWPQASLDVTEVARWRCHSASLCP